MAFVTGSHKENDTPVGQLTFMESGIIDIRTNTSSSIDPLILETFHMTSNFIFFALMRSDWMQEFAEQYEFSDEFSESETTQPSLTLIEGGKED